MQNRGLSASAVRRTDAQGLGLNPSLLLPFAFCPPRGRLLLSGAGAVWGMVKQVCR